MAARIGVAAIGHRKDANFDGTEITPTALARLAAASESDPRALWSRRARGDTPRARLAIAEPACPALGQLGPGPRRGVRPRVRPRTASLGGPRRERYDPVSGRAAFEADVQRRSGGPAPPQLVLRQAAASHEVMRVGLFDARRRSRSRDLHSRARVSESSRIGPSSLGARCRREAPESATARQWNDGPSVRTASLRHPSAKTIAHEPSR